MKVVPFAHKFQVKKPIGSKATTCRPYTMTGLVKVGDASPEAAKEPEETEMEETHRLKIDILWQLWHIYGLMGFIVV